MKILLLSTIVMLISASSFAESYAGRHYIYNRFLGQAYQQNKKLGLIDTTNIQNQKEVSLVLEPAVDQNCKFKISSSETFRRVSSLVQGHLIEVKKDSVNQIEITDGRDTVVVSEISGNGNYAYKHDSDLDASAGEFVEMESIEIANQPLVLEITGKYSKTLGFNHVQPELLKISHLGHEVRCKTNRSIYLK